MREGSGEDVLYQNFFLFFYVLCIITAGLYFNLWMGCLLITADFCLWLGSLQLRLSFNFIMTELSLIGSVI